MLAFLGVTGRDFKFLYICEWKKKTHYGPIIFDYPSVSSFFLMPLPFNHGTYLNLTWIDSSLRPRDPSFSISSENILSQVTNTAGSICPIFLVPFVRIKRIEISPFFIIRRRASSCMWLKNNFIFSDEGKFKWIHFSNFGLVENMNSKIDEDRKILNQVPLAPGFL